MTIDLHPFARVQLGHRPTPIDHALNLSADIGIDLWIKRDDCTGLAFGGNKVRQLEFYMGEAQAREADTVLITGAVQSNFMRTTAAAARLLGMDPHLQLEQRVAKNDERYFQSGNVHLERLLGATLYDFEDGEDEAAADANLERIAAKLAAKGRKPYVIHLGISHAPIGGLGYVVAAQEITEQIGAMEALSDAGRDDKVDAKFDAIVVASGSALTHAGLLTGLRALGDTTPVHGICVRRPVAEQGPRVLQRAREIAAMIGHNALITDADVLVHDEVFFPSYGTLNDATWNAIDKAARMEALFLDPVYTGRTLAGCIALVKQGVLRKDSRVLLMHTGGQPALFAYESDLQARIEQR
jgi:D-cysteine desulfhydrase family pyridoxal phosphate-dependent enzyme